MLNETDYTESKKTLGVIKHVIDQDNAPHRLSFVKILEIIDFILTGVNRLLFTKEGKPKSKLQLILSLFEIVMFLRDVVRLINGNLQYKPRPVATNNSAYKGDDSQK